MEKIMEKKPLAESNDCQVYQFRNETGEGTITIYDVFPGVMLAYNDFHMSYYDSVYQPGQELFCIDHCREGRLEYPSGNNAYSYVEAGDLKLDRRLTHVERFEMPLSHYHGAMVAVDLNIAETVLKEEMKGFPVDLRKLQQKFCADIYPKVIHEPASVEHIFGELYHVPEKIKKAYFKIKVLELFLYLDALEIPDSPDEKPYFYKTQVEKTKALKAFLEEHMQEKFTQEELAKRFDLPMTAMKRCFKSIYGMSIGSWILQYRMNYAAEVLIARRDVSIADLAGEVGYDSQSKFALAFRRVMGMSPTEYRSRKAP
ncbi:MAG: helix-turn-helix domain-containing protein [Roseburia sp.]